MTQMVTRCPKCATSFRITSTQIETAKGSVRCGSCLHIFKANDHLVNKKSSEPFAQKAQTTKAPIVNSKETTKTIPAAKSIPATSQKSGSASAIKPETKQNFSAVPTKKSNVLAKTSTEVKTAPVKKSHKEDEDDDFLISDDMDKLTEKKEGYEFDGFIDIDLHPKQNISLFEREIRYDTPKEDVVGPDESWAESLLDDDDDVPQIKSKRIAPVESPIKITASKSEPKQAAIATAPQNHDEHSERPHPPLFSLIPDVQHLDEPELHDEFLKTTSYEENIQNRSSEPPSFTNLFDENESSSSEEDNSSSKRPVKSATKIRYADSSRASLLMNIIPAPVEFAAERVRNWYQSKMWPSLAVLAGLILFFQVAYFKFDYFSRVEPYRSIYAITCPIFHCKVPTLVDTRQIVTYNLLVRNHPKIADALMVDAIILNKAPFEQPFPDFILAFRTIDDTPIAVRRFKPKEYLAGELAGMEHIPPNQPVHITIELADPGSEAVNYSARIP